MGFFKNKKKTEEAKKVTTLEEVRKAYEDLSENDKKRFDEGRKQSEQTVADRVHESIAAQESDRGQTDSQSAADREHEALGEEHAEGKGDVSELHETDKTAEKTEGGEWHDKLESRLGSIEAAIKELIGKHSADGKLEESRQKYGFSPRAGKLDDGEKLTPEEAIERLRRA